MLVDAIVSKNLTLYRNRSILSATPVEGWDYQILAYREKEDYELLKDWVPYTFERNFCPLQHTCKMRTVFTPRRPAETEDAYFEFRVPGGCEAFVIIDGVDYVGIDNDLSRARVYLTDEMYVHDAYIPTTKFADIAYAKYTLTVESDKMPDNALSQIAKLFFVSAPIMMTKRSKSGEREVDIKSFIKDITAEVQDNTLKINAVLSAGSTENLNPEYLITAIKQNTDIFADGRNVSYRIMRETVYDANMKEFC